jgi:hypothetical protein
MSNTLEQLQDLALRPAAVGWFQGLFHRIHLQITDTGENFTVLHHGDRMEVQSGFLSQQPNFVAPLETQNIRNLAGFFDQGTIGPYEQYRIVKFMMRPCIEAALAMPILNHQAILKIVRVDPHFHTALVDPDGHEDEQLTVLYVNNQWLVLSGHHGKPQRRVARTPEQLLEFQRHLHQADEQNTLAAWMDAARWYLKWREEVTKPI